MPTFPTDDSLPRCLNVFNPTHHALFLYWLFFHHSSLKIYLYQIDKELYFKKGLAIFRTLIMLAYLNFYLIALVQAFFLSSMVILLFWGFETLVLQAPVSYFFINEGNNLDINTLQTVTPLMNLTAMFKGMAFGVALGVAVGVAFGVAYGVVFGVALGVAFGVAVGVGSSRSFFYPWQWLLRQLNLSSETIIYDELLVLPVSTPYAYFEQQWQKSDSQTLSQLAHIAANPFQRYQAQRILFVYYQQQPFPLIYKILQQDNLQLYAIFPIEKDDIDKFLDKCSLLLAELGCVYFKVSHSSEEWVWKLTKHLRRKDDPVLTAIAALMFELYRAKPEKLTEILNQAMDLYPKIRIYPYGDEIADSLIAFANCLNIQQLELISQQHKSLTQTPITDDNLRPEVIQAQHQLARASRDIQAYCDATSRQNKLAAIARSLDTLENLEQNIKTLHQPEQKIIQAIIDHWQPLLTKEGGAVGRFNIEKPIENPFVAGNPVTGKLFVGRDDIYRELESLWMSKNPASVVIYGHRRMGKTSILHNLGCRFGDHKHIIDFNLQRIRAKTLQDLLYQLADSCYLKTKKIFKLSKPQSADFADDPCYSFDCFLQEINEQQSEPYQYLIVTLDEFENLEQRMNAGTLDKGLIDYFRGVIQTYPWFILAFAGLHTLEEMRKDYFNPLFGSIKAIKISFLKDAPARLLITEPTEDFPLDYDQDVIDKIIQLTYGQAYLIQQICHNLISLYNEQKFDQSQQRADRFSMEDLNKVLSESKFFQDSDFYFTGIWGQADDMQKQVLIQLAQAETGLHQTELHEQLDMDREILEKAIKTLQNHDVIDVNQEGYQIRVPLMKQWINTF